MKLALLSVGVAFTISACIYYHRNGEAVPISGIDRGGFETKEKLIDWAYNNACMPAGEYWDYQFIQN